MNTRFVVFDIETTGLGPDAKIIQLAAVAVDEEWQVLDSFEVKIEFVPKPADADALRMNSYDKETWTTEAIDSALAARSFAQFLKKHASVRKISKQGHPYSVAQLVGHNASAFDMPRLIALFQEHRELLPASFEVLDTLHLARWLRSLGALNPEDLRLGSLAKEFDIEEILAHDALGDVRVTARVAQALTKIARAGL